MKKILVVYTGGTICSFLKDENRVLDVESAKRVIIDNFAHSKSEYAKFANKLFVDSKLDVNTLSENMTFSKLNEIIKNISKANIEKYSGVIILHGTDTLTYTSTMLSFLFCNASVPIMLVSANRPPNDPLTNANSNFNVAVDLIMDGIAPNVYVPYKNSDGKMWVHLASTILPCNNFSEDFYNASSQKVFLFDTSASKNNLELFEKSWIFSKKRSNLNFDLLQRFSKLEKNIMYIKPYVGIDYDSISLEGIKAIVCGTFHSGTVCVERENEEDEYTKDSILFLADKCLNKGIIMYMAPCVIDAKQYSSAYDAAKNGQIIPLDMVTEAVYTKLLICAACNIENEELKEFMKLEINNEFITEI